jgi:hypothetical protein
VIPGAAGLIAAVSDHQQVSASANLLRSSARSAMRQADRRERRASRGQRHALSAESAAYAKLISAGNGASHGGDESRQVVLAGVAQLGRALKALGRACHVH